MITLEGYEVKVSEGVDLSVPVIGTPKVKAFGTDYASSTLQYEPRDDGTGCNCAIVTFCPQTNCTHIEYSAHIYKQWPPSPMSDLLALYPLMLVKVIDVAVEDCSVNDFQAEEDTNIQAIILRSGWIEKHLTGASSRVNLTDPNLDPIYINPGAMLKLKRLFPNIRILLFDSISVDPVEDGGALLAHKCFFGDKSEPTKFIIEVCRIPGTVKAGLYAISINAAAFNLDAIPCRPILYPISWGCPEDS